MLVGPERWPGAHGHALDVPVAEAPDLRQRIRRFRERVIARNPAILVQAHDLAVMRIELLRSVTLVAVAQADVEVPVVDHEASAEVVAVLDAGNRREEPLAVLESEATEPGAIYHRSGARGITDRVGEIQPEVPPVVRVQDHVEQSAVALGVHRGQTLNA